MKTECESPPFHRMPSNDGTIRPDGHSMRREDNWTNSQLCGIKFMYAMPKQSLRITMVLIVLCQVAVSTGQTFDERYSDWPEETSLGGTIVLVPPGADFKLVADLLRLQNRSLTVNVLTEAKNAESQAAVWNELLGIEEPGEGDSEKPKGSTVTVVKSEETPEGVAQQLKPLTDDADIVCWHAGGVSTSDEVPWSKIGVPLHDFVRDGGTLVLSGAPAETAGRVYVNSEGSVVGWNLIPDASLRFLQPDDLPIDRVAAVKREPKSVGLFLDIKTVLAVSGRKLRIAGPGTAELILPEGPHHAIRRETLKPFTGRRQRPTEFLADWTEWRRDAIDRTLPEFPPAQPQTPHVKNGTLMIVGGGGMPKGLMDRFVEAAGGPEEARLVYIPCAEEERVNPLASMVRLWSRMGVKHATMLHTKDRHKANTDDEFLKPLKDATGIWFGGGRQWNFADSWYGTKGHRMMKDVVLRGGVVGGSSAGASIQPRYLARATPIENFRIMAPGYERGGLGFISGIAVDQHFTQRGRQKDMTQLVNRYPQMLGIGIDEATAIVVKGSKAEVVGEGEVYFYDRAQSPKDADPDYVKGAAGKTFDLKARKFVD